jgi:hypothetical protein
VSWLLAAYVAPAIVAWVALGMLLNTLPVRYAALVVMVAYCAYYGVSEALGLPGLRPPGSRWQVPQSFVRGASQRRRVLVWGAILGPGLATRNPYAGFALLLLALATIGTVPDGVLAAAAVGVAHAGGRALALLRDAGDADRADYFVVALKSMYSRQLDGLALLVIGSVALIAAGNTVF